MKLLTSESNAARIDGMILEVLQPPLKSLECRCLGKLYVGCGDDNINPAVVGQRQGIVELKMPADDRRHVGAWFIHWIASANVRCT